MKKMMLLMVGMMVLGTNVYAKKAGRGIASLPTRNVQIAEANGLDACGQGIILATTSLMRLDANGLNNTAKYGTVGVNQSVEFCDSTDEGLLGVVFGNPGQDCKVEQYRGKEYKGPCKSGWVKSEFALLIAG